MGIVQSKIHTCCQSQRKVMVQGISLAPPDIDCGNACSAEFTEGTPVTLTATPDTGSTFASWSGSCNATGEGKVTMNNVKSVTVTFLLDADRDGVPDETDKKSLSL